MCIFHQLLFALFVTGTALFSTNSSAQMDSRSQTYESYFGLSGFLLRASVACKGDFKQTVQLSLRVIASDELKRISAAYPKTTEKWMMDGAEAFNSIVMKDDLATACGPALQFFQEKAIRLLKLTAGANGTAAASNPQANPAPKRSEQNQAANAVPSPRSASAGKDSYADAYKQQKQLEYVRNRDTLLKNIHVFYFAGGCGVLGEGSVQLLHGNYVMSFVQANLVDHSDLRKLVDEAAETGKRRAANPGQCAFWKQHPELVYDLRREGLMEP